MLRFLATGLLTRNVSRRLARVIPNPLVRTVAIAAAGLAVERLVSGRRGRATAPRLSGLRLGGRRAAGLLG